MKGSLYIMSSKLQLPALAIFDMDGLIFDTERLFMTTKDGVMKEYGYTQQKDDYIHTIGTCGQQLLDILHRLYGDDYPAEEISQKCRTLVTEKIRRDGPPTKPGIPELLAWFTDKHIPCCVASSTKYDIVTEYLRLANLDNLFFICYWRRSGTAFQTKPGYFFWQHVSRRASDRKLHLCWKTPKTVF